MKNKFFNSIASKKPQSSLFDLSRERKMSMKMGFLTPCFLQEVVPGDSFNVEAESLVKMAPLQAPIMHRIDCHIHYFFVPNRLVWNEWEDFITGGDDGTEVPSFPRMEFGGADADTQFGQGSIADYFGLPILDDDAAGTNYVSALPFRAYQLIWNEYYRDQNLQDSINFSLGSGIQDTNQKSLITAIRKRCWEKDYFTSALPEAQKGADVILPLGDTAPIEYVPDGFATGAYDTAGNLLGGTNVSVVSDNVGADSILKGGAPQVDVSLDVSDQHEVDLSNATGATIEDLRKATAIQRFLELAMRGGSRYKEMLYNFFGVRSGDARLDRPEYLGGGKKPVVISEVLSTYNNSANAGDQPVGEMYGHGSSMGRGYGFKGKAFTEHGYIIGIMSVLPRTAYSQGIGRTWTKFDKFDHYFPTFANLGEQEVLNKELYVNNDATDNNTFGYQQRYAEYKYACDSVHGDFRNTLDFWHMGREFANQPQLNSAFVTADPTNRVFQVIDNIDNLWCQVYHHVSARRSMPYHSRPSLI